jgi:hypothetical protein
MHGLRRVLHVFCVILTSASLEVYVTMQDNFLDFYATAEVVITK